MRTLLHPHLLLLLAAALTPVRAQQTPMPLAGERPAATSPTFDTHLACGIDHDEEGRWIGMADGYLARFEADGIEYVPALGKAAAHDMPWRFRWIGVGRGAESTAPATSQPRRVDAAIHYERPGMTERYTVLATGVKQDFVLHTLPAGNGDLVVRGAVTTELQAGPIEATGLRFELPGVGGVEVGAVTGIDATGRRMPGSIRWHDGTIEFVLPAAFVDDAVLPLTVDPLLGTFSTTTLAGTGHRKPDAAPISGPATFVVWEQVLSATNTDIRGLRFLNGAFFGSVRAFESSSTVNSYGPRVAALEAYHNWIVVYGAAQSVFARTYWSGDVVNPPVTISTTGTGPTVGGDPRDIVGDTATIAWIDTAGGVRLRTASISGNTDTPTLGAVTTVTTGGTGSGQVDISRTGGASGHWLVVYPRLVPPGIVRMYARVWNGTALVTTEGTSIATSLVASVDGDGANWVVAYQVAETPANGLYDIHARAVRWDGVATSNGTATAVSNLAGFDETGPSVAWTGSSALIAYTTTLTPTLKVGNIESVDPITCSTCENIQFLDTTSSDDWARVVSISPNGQFTGKALALWSGGFTGTCHVQSYQALDGAPAYLGGGCGAGGEAVAACAHSPNPNFALRLEGATPSTATFAIFGDDTFGFACGSCDFVVDPFAGIVIGTTTSSTGTAAIPVPIPSAAAGRRFRNQWATLGTSCVSAVDLSHGVRIQIE